MASQNDNLVHQLGQSFPSINVPMVDEKGFISRSWYQFLVFLWNNTQRGAVTPHEETPGASPWTYTMDITGELLIFGGSVQQITLSRDGANFYDVGLTSGPVSAVLGDQIKITYTAVPRVIHFPM